jgi:hypothetical protein
MPVILATQEAEIWPAQVNSSQNSISKTTTAKSTGGVAQVVE